MRFVTTKHADDVLAERGIPGKWVQRVLDAPEKTEPDPDDEELEHRLAASRRMAIASCVWYLTRP
jgi:hypothetical protein